MPLQERESYVHYTKGIYYTALDCYNYVYVATVLDSDGVWWQTEWNPCVTSDL